MPHSTTPIASELSGPLRYQQALSMPRGKLAMLLFMSTEVMFFTAIIGTYVVLRFSSALEWPRQATMHVELWLGLINTMILISSSFTLFFAIGAAKKNAPAQAKTWLLATLLLAISFLSIKGYEYSQKFNHGFYPSAKGSLIHDQADETYLSQSVAEARKIVSMAEGNGIAPEELKKLYQIQSGVVEWSQYKVGRASDRLNRRLAIDALAYRVFPVAHSARLEKYLDDELNEVEREQQRLQESLANAEIELKQVQQQIKELLPRRDSNDDDVQRDFSQASNSAERLTDSITGIRKELIPIEARLAVDNEFNDSQGINHKFKLKLPMVITNGKSWVNTYYLLTGFHAVHLIIGVFVMGCWLFVRLNQSRVHLLENFSIYWHFVDLVWLVIFAIVYLC